MPGTYYPDFETFCKVAPGHNFVPVSRCLAADTLTPVSAFYRIRRGNHAFLFESVVGGEQVGRYSFLGSEPFLVFSAKGHQVRLEHTSSGTVYDRTSKNPLADLRQLVRQHDTSAVEGLPPFVGGAVGYVGYDCVRYCEHLPNPPRDDRGLPDMHLAFYDQMLIVDNAQKTIRLVALAPTNPVRGEFTEHHHQTEFPRSPGPGMAQTAVPTVKELHQAYERACGKVDRLLACLTADTPSLPIVEFSQERGPLRPAKSNFTQAEFESAVCRCVDAIRAGDIFQVVLSQRLEVPLRSAPLEVYRSLRSLNPSPFMFLLETPAACLVGSSPEIMCRLQGRRVTVRPLAGTRARGRNPQEDEQLAADLLQDPKERAEHVMLVDLGRNDVGRVARFGTVELTDIMHVERYSHVMHLTSNVSGILEDSRDAFDALMACLPAGTVSGAPKVRAMQIIDELEPHRRGPYAGAVGYFDFRGNMDTCIALRTIVIQNGVAYVQAGAGIVADSIPAREYEETMNKAHVLLRALQITEQRTRPSPVPNS